MAANTKPKEPKLNITVNVIRITRESDPVLYEAQLQWWRQFLAKSDAKSPAA